MIDDCENFIIRHLVFIGKKNPTPEWMEGVGFLAFKEADSRSAMTPLVG
jgi:hypothetical protein